MTRLKRYSMPGYWPVGTKERKWIVSPLPGPHRKEMCIPLQVIVRDILSLAETSAEAKKIINSGKITVDKKIRKEPNYPAGFMDAVEIPDIKKHYRLMINKDGLFLKEIKQSDADKKICKILKKSVLKKDRQQITLHDGRNILVEKKNPYRVGDSILIQLPNQKILEHYKLQKGANAIILKGKNMGFGGEIKEIHDRKTMTEKSAVLIKSGETEIETLKDYIIVVGSSERGK